MPLNRRSLLKALSALGLAPLVGAKAAAVGTAPDTAPALPTQGGSPIGWYESPRFDAIPVACRVVRTDGVTDFPIEVLSNGSWRCTIKHDGDRPEPYHASLVYQKVPRPLHRFVDYYDRNGDLRRYENMSTRISERP